jgi:competence protein ComFB
VKRYENMMEGFVEEVLDIMGDSLGCCMCEQCRNDVAAHALNQLPPRYVVSHMGGAISKADTMRIQHLTDVRTAVLQAAQVVKEHPRH